jgi:hypothetical protein
MDKLQEMREVTTLGLKEATICGMQKIEKV